MEAAIPQMPQWKQAGLPRYLPAPEVERVIGSVLDHTAQGRRNYAMLLLLARMGLRAEEVMKLTLDDIDWREGVIRIRATKSHRDRMMPLSQEVGAALYVYLEHARPQSGYRAVFLRLRPPFKPFHDSSAISRMVRRALIRAGIVGAPAAAHLFRHAAATGMVTRGATFKEVADVLGHASIATTAIYAKLDIAALSRVALPWPERAP
jgi:site-specific recombinase XerD